MSSDDYQVKNIYRYSRKTYKKNRRGGQENDQGGCSRDDGNCELLDDDCPRTECAGAAEPGCTCVDPDADIASVLHKKCPVISLAQQQLQRLLEGTDRLLCDNTRCCRSVYDFICICKELLKNQNKLQCVLLVLIALAFFVGVLVGAASCGSYLGRFNSPLLTCIDTFFMPDKYHSVQDSFRSIT